MHLQCYKFQNNYLLSFTFSPKALLLQSRPNGYFHKLHVWSHFLSDHAVSYRFLQKNPLKYCLFLQKDLLQSLDGSDVIMIENFPPNITEQVIIINALLLILIIKGIFYLIFLMMCKMKRIYNEFNVYIFSGFNWST